MLQKAKDILGNPIFTFVFGIILSIFFYWLAKETQELSYSVSAEEVIAAPKDDSPDLSFTWKGKVVDKELKRIKVAIWNSGSKYIDKSMFSIDNPLTVNIKKNNLEIVGQNISTTSRNSLRVKIINSEDSNTIQLRIDGDDGLEKSDGFILSVFYIGEEKPKIGLFGRIKGISGNFVKVNWAEINSSLARDSKILMIGSMTFIFIGVLLLMSSLQIFAGSGIFKFIVYDIFAPSMGLCLLCLGIIQISGLFKTALYGLEWIP